MKLLKVCLSLMIALQLFGCDSNSSSSEKTAESKQTIATKAVSSGYKVVGYTPSWGAYDVAQIQYDKLTHICYAFMIPQADGTFSPIENPARLQQIVSLAHANGVKVSIAIGGWNAGTANFSALASTPALRTKFVNNVMAFVAQYNLDGVDMDWEYPQPGSTDKNFTLLMTEFATALHAKGKELSAAVVALGPTAAGIQDEVLRVIDFLNIMAYDGGNGATHSPYSYAVDSLNYWLGRGLAPEKAILGVPFYSRPGWTPYKDIVALDTNNANVDFANGQYYNGIPTIKQKTELAMQVGGGIMIWELSQDTHDHTSLLSAIYEVIGGPVIPDNEAPTVPANLTGTGGEATATLNWTASTDNIGVTGYKIYMDGTYLTTVTTNSARLTQVSPGNRVFTVSAIDRAKNESLQSAAITLKITAPISTLPKWDPTEVYTGGMEVFHNNAEWRAGWWNQNQEPGKDNVWKLIRILVTDNEAPSVPTGLASSNLTFNSVALAWTAATDNVAVTGYKVYQNGIEVADVATTSAAITGLVEKTTYSFTVSAYDAAGNESANSLALSVTTPAKPIDTQAPIPPTGLYPTTIKATSVRIDWTKSFDNVGVTGYKVFQDGVEVATTVDAYIVINGLTPKTTYSFAASAFDAAGNESTISLALSITTKDTPAYPTWEKTKIYVNGDRVIWKGITYEAQWYADGQEPGTTGEWGVWRVVP